MSNVLLKHNFNTILIIFFADYISPFPGLYFRLWTTFIWSGFRTRNISWITNVPKPQFYNKSRKKCFWRCLIVVVLRVFCTQYTIRNGRETHVLKGCRRNNFFCYKRSSLLGFFNFADNLGKSHWQDQPKYFT